MLSPAPLYSLVLGAGLLCLAASSPAALAGETEAAAKARARADKICGDYGAGFVAGAQPGQCIKVDERLRVDRNARRAMSPWDAPIPFAPLQPGDGALPAHLRLNGGFGAGQATRPR